jgi:hypothetical protein
MQYAGTHACERHTGRPCICTAHAVQNSLATAGMSHRMRDPMRASTPAPTGGSEFACPERLLGLGAGERAVGAVANGLGGGVGETRARVACRLHVAWALAVRLRTAAGPPQPLGARADHHLKCMRHAAFKREPPVATDGGSRLRMAFDAGRRAGCVPPNLRPRIWSLHPTHLDGPSHVEREEGLPAAVRVGKQQCIGNSVRLIARVGVPEAGAVVDGCRGAGEDAEEEEEQDKGSCDHARLRERLGDSLDVSGSLGARSTAAGGSRFPHHESYTLLYIVMRDRCRERLGVSSKSYRGATWIVVEYGQNNKE